MSFPLRKTAITAPRWPHQAEGLKQILFGRRQQLYDDKSVHDVEKAIIHLQKQLLGFLVEAPLDWGINTKVKGNPTGDTSVDVAALKINPTTGKNRSQA
jgi:hypothetical protein